MEAIASQDCKQKVWNFMNSTVGLIEYAHSCPVFQQQFFVKKSKLQHIDFLLTKISFFWAYVTNGEYNYYQRKTNLQSEGHMKQNHELM